MGLFSSLGSLVSRIANYVSSLLPRPTPPFLSSTTTPSTAASPTSPVIKSTTQSAKAVTTAISDTFTNATSSAACISCPSTQSTSAKLDSATASKFDQSPTMPSNVKTFLQQHLDDAIAVHEKWNIPVSVVLAQAADETGWGSKVVGNVYFAVKGQSESGQSVSVVTHEFVNGVSVPVVADFRSGYADFAESADDYGRYLTQNPRYAAAFQHTDDPVRFAQEIAKAGYASNPKYGDDLTSIITKYTGRFDQ